MRIAGMVDGPDAAVALVEVGADGVTVPAVVHQQSVDRVAHSAAFPSAALDAALDAAGWKARDLDRIVLTNLSALPSRWGDVAAVRPRVGQVLTLALRRTGAYRLVHDRAAERVARWAEGAGFRAYVTTLETDLALAHLAYRTQALDPLRIVVSGRGRDGSTLAVFEARNGQIDPLPLPAGSHRLPELQAALGASGVPVILADGPDAALSGSAAAALGAALWDAGSAPHPLVTTELGPDFSSIDAYRALSNAEEPRDRLEDAALLAEAAAVLRTGGTVGWARGRAGAEAELLPTRALLAVQGPGVRIGGAEGRGVSEPTLAALLARTGPLVARPLARPGEPAALTPTDVVRTFRALRGAAPGAPSFLVLHDYVVRVSSP